MLAPGDLVDGRYRVEARVGNGATGQVYRCTDVDLRRTCCLKLLSEGSHEALRSEAAALASLRHEHVVGIYTFGSHLGRAFFAMEFVEGRDLAAQIDEHYREHETAIPVRQAVRLVRELCDGVSAVHAAGIVHRDIKPANVVVEARTGRLVLVDFGAAVVARGHEGPIVGTPRYMAPEIFRGDPPTARADLYSIGCLAFELLTGRPPFVSDDLREMREMHLSAPIPRPSTLRAELAPHDAVFETLLAKKPRERPATAAMLANMLEDREAPPSVGPVSELSVSSPGSLRVLVVDDDPTFARMAARCAQIALPGVNISVSRASSGADAVENASRRRPDLIVLDYLLPDTTGDDVLVQIRAQHGYHADVLVASGVLGRRERWRFHILGVSAFVDKPIEFHDLTARIHEIAERRGWLAPEVAP